MQGSGIFRLNSSSRQLKWIPLESIDRTHKFARNKLRLGIRSNHLEFRPFVAPAFDLSAELPDIDGDINYSPLRFHFIAPAGVPAATWSAQEVRRQVLSFQYFVPSYLMAVTPQHWSQFWALNLTTVWCNVIYRFISRKLPCNSLFQYLFKSDASSAHYTICNSGTIETPLYFLFLCPPKQFVWNNIIFEFL
jgi:hypothetical protein